MEKKEEMVVSRSSERQKVIVRTLEVSCSSDLDQYENTLPSRTASVWKVIDVQYETDVLKLWRYHFGHFEGVTHILRISDSGPHFRSRNMRINLCDAHGGAVKRCAKAAAVGGTGPKSSQEFATIFNSDKRTGAAEAEIVD